ncbi:hypothetical protein D3C78_1212950 [compost metagenome]
MAVVRLDDLDIHLVAQHARGSVQQLQAEVHANAVVGREDDRDILRRVGQQLLFLDAETGGTDHHGLACLAADFQVLQGHRRMGEVDQHVELIQHLRQVARQRHTDAPQPGQFAGIGTDQGAVRTVDGRRQAGTATSSLHRLDQVLAHAPGGAHHGYTSHKNSSRLRAAGCKRRHRLQPAALVIDRRRNASCPRTSHWPWANGRYRSAVCCGTPRAARAGACPA